MSATKYYNYRGVQYWRVEGVGVREYESGNLEPWGKVTRAYGVTRAGIERCIDLILEGEL